MCETHRSRRASRASHYLMVAVLLLGAGVGATPRPARAPASDPHAGSPRQARDELGIGSGRAATPGLLFVEDFSDDTLRDSSLTNANWSTGEQALVLARRRPRYEVFGAGLTGSDIGIDTLSTTSLALGDVDGDGDLDLVTGNHTQANRLYLNGGAASPAQTNRQGLQ